MLPQSLMFFRGLIEVIILFISALIFVFSGILNLSFTGNYLNILICIIFIFAIFCKTFCLIKVIDKFSPQHVSFIIIAKSFAGVLNQFQGFKEYENSLSDKMKYLLVNIFDIISIFIILFGTL